MSKMYEVHVMPENNHDDSKVQNLEDWLNTMSEKGLQLVAFLPVPKIVGVFLNQEELSKQAMKAMMKNNIAQQIVDGITETTLN